MYIMIYDNIFEHKFVLFLIILLQKLKLLCAASLILDFNAIDLYFYFLNHDKGS